MMENDRLPRFTVSQIQKLNIINEGLSLEDGLRMALKDASKKREIQKLAKESGVSPSTIYQFKGGFTDGISLYNAERLLDAMGLEIIVRPKL